MSSEPNLAKDLSEAGWRTGRAPPATEPWMANLPGTLPETTHELSSVCETIPKVSGAAGAGFTVTFIQQVNKNKTKQKTPAEN